MQHRSPWGGWSSPKHPHLSPCCAYASHPSYICRRNWDWYLVNSSSFAIHMKTTSCRQKSTKCLQLFMLFDFDCTVWLNFGISFFSRRSSSFSWCYRKICCTFQDGIEVWCKAGYFCVYFLVVNVIFEVVRSKSSWRQMCYTMTHLLISSSVISHHLSKLSLSLFTFQFYASWRQSSCPSEW